MSRDPGMARSWGSSALISFNSGFLGEGRSLLSRTLVPVPGPIGEVALFSAAKLPPALPRYQLPGNRPFPGSGDIIKGFSGGGSADGREHNAERGCGLLPAGFICKWRAASRLSLWFYGAFFFSIFFFFNVIIEPGF